MARLRTRIINVLAIAACIGADAPALADGGTWQEQALSRTLALHIRTMPEACRVAWAAMPPDARAPHHYPLRIGEDTAVRDALMIGLPCREGTEGTISLWYLADEHGVVGAQWFPAPQFSLRHHKDDPDGAVDAVELGGTLHKREIANARYDPASRIMREHTRWSGEGGAYSVTHWGYHHGTFRLISLDVDASRDGVDNPRRLIEHDIW